MNHPTRELLINCGMVPVSALSFDGLFTRGYWHSLSCSNYECYVSRSGRNEYELVTFPIIIKDSGAACLKSNNQREVGVIL